MLKFINNVKIKEQLIGYELFNKKKLYEICGSYENYISNKTPFCPHKLRLFLTSEYCDLSKVIPTKEDIKFIIMNPSLTEDYFDKYKSLFIGFLNDTNVANWISINEGTSEFNKLSEREFINIWGEVNRNVAWNTCDEQAILTFMLLTIENIIKLSDYFHINNITEFNSLIDERSIGVFNKVKKAYYNPSFISNSEKYKNDFDELKRNLDKLIKETYKVDCEYNKLINLFSDMDYSYRIYESIKGYENFSVASYFSKKINPDMISKTNTKEFWKWNEIVEREDLTIKFIKDNLEIINSQRDKKWLWAKISQAKYVYNDTILQNPDIHWDWRHVIQNKNLTFELFDKLPENMPYQDWVWHHLSNAEGLTERFVNKYKDKNWSWELLVLHPNISRKFIKDNINKVNKCKIYIPPCAFIPKLENKLFDLELDIDYHLLSNNYHLSYDIVNRYRDKNWEWADLLGRSLSKNIILRFYHTMPESIKLSMFRRESETSSLYPIPGEISIQYIDYMKTLHIKALRISRFFRDILYNPKYESAKRNIMNKFKRD